MLESLASVNVVAFDKTGTLTQGKLRLVGMQTGDGVDGAQLLAWAAAVERSTRHPLADAVLLAAQQQEVQVRRESQPGSLVGLLVSVQACADSVRGVQTQVSRQPMACRLALPQASSTSPAQVGSNAT